MRDLPMLQATSEASNKERNILWRYSTNNVLFRQFDVLLYRGKSCWFFHTADIDNLCLSTEICLVQQVAYLSENFMFQVILS